MHVMHKIELDKATAWLVLRESMSHAERVVFSRLPVKASVPIQEVIDGVPVMQQIAETRRHPFISTPDSNPRLGLPQAVTSSTKLKLHFITWEPLTRF